MQTPSTSTDVIDEAGVPRVAALRRVLRERFGFLKDAIDRAAGAFGPDWAAEFDDTLTRLFPEDAALEAAAEGYARFVMDLLRRQRAFERDRVYPAKTYAEAAAEVYFDEAYMTSQYLPGLLIAHFLWPHHNRHAAFFDTAFLAAIRRSDDQRFAEVGVGTGLYSRRVLEQAPGSTGVGFDISPASAAFAARHLGAFGLDDRYELRLQDVVAEPMDPVPWLICIEVLEHLEDPVGFMRALRGQLAPGGRAFITAALTAAHVDHIHLYETVDDVLVEVRDAGFVVEQAFLANAHAPSAPGVPVPAVAAVIVA